MGAHQQGAGILVCGGYCKIKDTQKGAQGKMLQDAWWLNMQQVNACITSKMAVGNIWEKLTKKASLPSIRSGESMRYLGHCGIWVFTTSWYGIWVFGTS